MDRPALRRCVGPATGAFAADYWGRRPLLCRGRRDGYADLLDLAGIDELLSRRGLRTPFLRVVQAGSPVDAGRFTCSGGIGAEIGDQVADDRLAALVADGATLVLQGLHRLWPPIIDFAAALTTDLGHPVQFNAYVTPPSSQGLAAHYDVHDVFVLQIAGTKRWLVHEPVHPLPLRTQPSTGRRAQVAAAATAPPALDVVLRPGDSLYLPRGWLHAARAQDEVSAHLTVGVHAVTRYALVEALCALAADEPALRESLPVGVDLTDRAAMADERADELADELAGELAETVRALVKRVEAAEPAEVAARLRAAVWPATRPAPLGPLAQARAVREVTADSAVRLRGHLRSVLRTGGERVELILADRTVTFPAFVGSALAVLLTGEPVIVGDLPGLDAADALVLVRRLLREAVVVPAA